MKKELLKRVKKIEVYYLDSETVVAKEVASETRATMPEKRDHYFESDICPGLFFLKYRNDVEYEGEGQAGLSALQFNIFLLLNDEGGDADVDDAKRQCWGKEPTHESFKNVVSTLNEKLANISVPKFAQIENGRLIFR